MDTYHPTLIFAIIFVLMLINVFFAMAETALTESHKSRLEKMVDDNVPDAKAALELFEAPELAFVVVQIGITLVSILMGVATSVLLSPVVGEYISFVPYHNTVALVASIVVVTYFTLLLSEFLPNSIAMRHPEQTLINCQGTLRTLVKVTRPITAILEASASFFLSFFGINLKYEDVKERLKAYTTGDVVSKVSCTEKYEVSGAKDLSDNGPLSGSASFNKDDYEACLKGDLSRREKRPSLVKELKGKGLKVALLDVGAKRNISDALLARGCEVTIYPYNTTAEEILADKPDGIMLSNGPGDPKECTGVIEEIKKLYNSDVPIFAICLGHQLMALANGLDTHKLKYGHRGGNHPVKDLETGKVYISSQNHGYVVDTDGLDEKIAVPAFVNVNDGTNEGLKYTGKNIFTVQFHPEACPGPQDSGYLFDRFIKMMGGEQ